MMRINSRFFRSTLATSMLGIVLLHSAAAKAHDYKLGSLVINHPWAVATPAGAKVGVGYLKITNTGAQPDRLISLASPVASKVAVHASVKEGDVIKMRLLEQGLEIKPGQTVELSPEGTHVMFEGLSEPLVAGKRVKASLVFEKAGNIDVEYAVEPLGTKAPAAPVTHNH